MDRCRKLSKPDGRLQVGEFKIESNADVRVRPTRAAHGPALVFQLAQAGEKFFVVRHNRAPLPGRDGLVRRKRKTPGLGERAEKFAVTFGHERLGGIFDDVQAMLLGDREDRVHIGGASADVHGHDCAPFSR